MVLPTCQCLFFLCKRVNGVAQKKPSPLSRNEKLLDGSKEEFSKKNQAYGIWMVVKSAIGNNDGHTNGVNDVSNGITGSVGDTNQGKEIGLFED